MNTMAKTLLLLSTLLCAFTDAPTGCGAVPDLAASPDATTVDEAPTTPRLFRRSITQNLTSMAESALVELLGMPLDVLQHMGRFGQFIYDRLTALYKSLVFLYNQLGPRGIAANLFGLRSRRSLPTLSDILALNPIATLTRTMRSVQGVTDEQIGTMLSALMTPVYDFLMTKGLPWLREMIDTIAKTTDLSGPLRAAVDDFDALYRLLQVFGFTGSGAAG